MPAAGGATASVREVVVFRVREAALADRLRAAAHAQIAGFPGFPGALRLTALNDPGLSADVVWWRSFPEAQAAMTRLERDPAVQPFLAAVGPIVSIGQHPLPAAARADLLAQPAKAPVIEIAAYAVNDAKLQDAAQPGVHEALRSMPMSLPDTNAFTRTAADDEADAALAQVAGSGDADALEAVLRRDQH